ncbi:MAG: arsenic efflux protein [Bacilli bacterium]|nr:arsenic efflux protein [Bacilli bacterium]
MSETWRTILDVLVDSITDSLIVLAFVFTFHVVLSFFEGKVARLLEKNKKVAPLMGSLFGLVPQCGVSVVAADMYLKRHITMGTLAAVFIACSDEALPIVFANFRDGNWHGWIGFVVLLVKMIVGFIVGFLIDVIYKDGSHEVEHHHEHCEGEEETHIGCCHHEIEGEEESPWHEHLVHPLVHSLKIFAYVFAVTFVFGILIAFVGESNIASFLSQNKFLSPLFSVLVGLIPNCASSVLIAGAYNDGLIGVSSMVAGLIVNAGLGMVVLLKNKENIKKTLILWGVLIAASLAVGYGFIWVNF